MPQTNANNFTINKDIQNEFIFTIKQNDSLTPMIIDLSDTFSFKIYDLDTDELFKEVNMISSQDGIITIFDAANGQIKVVLNSDPLFRKERGSKEDKYYLKPTYRILIEGTTVNNGLISAKVPFVYVE